MNILPEEDITGFVIRQSFDRNQGRTLMKPATLAASTERLGWAFPSGLSSLADEIKIALPDTEGVIAKHTRFPLYARFLSPGNAKALRQHYEGFAMKGVAAHVGMTSGAFRSRMAVCPDCMQADIKDNGYTFWRRLHLTPGISACATHKRLLLTFCDACEAAHRRHRTNWSPTKRCLCGGSLKAIAELNDSEHAMAIAVASMASQILQGTAPKVLSAEAVTAALEHHFSRTKGPGTHLYELLREAFGKAMGTNLSASLGIGKTTLRRLVGSLKSEGLIRNPIQHLAAIHAVFGDFDGFTAALAKQEKAARSGVIDVPQKKPKNRRRTRVNYCAWVMSLTLEQKSALKMEARSWLLKRMHDSPTIQRTDLYRIPQSERHLLYLKHIDATWFDDILPPAESVRVRIVREQNLLQEVARLKKHIRKRYELSLQTQPMKRITKTVLMSHARCESKGNLALQSEDIQLLLDAYSETPAQRRQRVMQMVCLEMRKRYPDHPLGDEVTYLHLDHNNFASRISRARKWLTQNGK